jgi:uncharacterized membrane protein YhaH (DUF805 family)
MNNLLKGRYNRSVFWLGLGMLVVVAVGARLIFHSSHGVSEVMIVLFAVPRLHDIGRSGWLVLWGIGIELAALILAVIFLPMVLFPLALGLAGLVIAGLLIWLGCIKGDPGHNRFGQPPAPGLGSRRNPAR